MKILNICFKRNHSFRYWIPQLGFGAFPSVAFWPGLEVAICFKDSRPLSNEAFSKLQKRFSTAMVVLLVQTAGLGVHYKER